jgi:sialidase-1
MFQLLKPILVLLSLFIALTCASSTIDVFAAGDEGVLQYRIPALVRTGRGTLLAFAEARTDPSTDCGYKWLVVRRSVDDGMTWGKSISVAGESCLDCASGNPQAVFYPQTGATLVTYGVKRLSKGRNSCSPGDGVFVVDDGGSDGLSWGEPRNISFSLGSVFGGVVPGPGAGVVTSANSPTPGRIIFSGSSGAYDHDIVYFSDTGGLTWEISSTPLLSMDESCPTELANGTLYITMRNAHANACDCQAYSLSYDAGLTWTVPISYDDALISPECEAAVITYNGTLYFSNPASTSERANITVRRRLPGDAQWQAGTYLVAPGLTWGGYSSMAIGVPPLMADAAGAPAGGILFERNNSAVDVISFSLFPLTF